MRRELLRTRVFIFLGTVVPIFLGRWKKRYCGFLQFCCSHAFANDRCFFGRPRRFTLIWAFVLYTCLPSLSSSYLYLLWKKLTQKEQTSCADNTPVGQTRYFSIPEVNVPLVLQTTRKRHTSSMNASDVIGKTNFLMSRHSCRPQKTRILTKSAWQVLVPIFLKSRVNACSLIRACATTRIKSGSCKNIWNCWATNPAIWACRDLPTPLWLYFACLPSVKKLLYSFGRMYWICFARLTLVSQLCISWNMATKRIQKLHPNLFGHPQANL